MYTQKTSSYKKNITYFSSSVRRSGKSINFGDKKIQKSNFYKSKKVTKIDDIDFKKTLVSKEEPYDTKNSYSCSSLFDTMTMVLLGHYA